ncbi:MAG: transglycosylase SLT domain-containing protein [Prevotella sp.]|nr:transglycosylase SLT domain-containing protein [Prevotella sp.]MBQ1646009.1 transglycosylase SLT domain-containing protein [Prevotella sp.]MBQ1800348.1 transglycosylase SLT domain-containing protein [Prevotella sp.]MBQ2132136.1 transglycosylase SLT domain-containing protein [Prevotella sp.]MBQ2345023.1 transglycosylase SLT domain-containing protein [Prevotella sp.]
MHIKYVFLVSALALLSGCVNNGQSETTPWGTPLQGNQVAKGQTVDSVEASTYKLADIQNNGELIMLTLTGPDTYYDHRGYKMGLQYRLCEKFAQKIGVSLRVDVCKDEAEMVDKLMEGEGDVIAYTLPHAYKDVLYCASSWAVNKGNRELADSLNRWYSPQLEEKMKADEAFLLSTQSISRHEYAPVLNKAGGVISHYDEYFRRYAHLARWDWRLLAAQCYQESTFDPKAQSFAGACGLMQLMPATAHDLGLEPEQVWEPEKNIAAAAKYIGQLNYHFRDIRNFNERTKFVLAAYNGGAFHVRDAMSLTEKNGGNPHIWNEVSEYVRKLATPEFYNDSIVKYGYMRGSETADYVTRIHSLWSKYRGVAKPHHAKSTASGKPQKAKHKNKYRV